VYALSLVDEVALYDRALALDRIVLHHEVGITGPNN
jgi:hypothetical protein